ncbi:MAG: helix-turn-helix transcriptional regulator [Candidatus Cloacimonetes bacterium]|nr:helix-turn-helix transcriptional regulator [Candidatus Cloacimonadota bacterium]MDD3972189.1 helix-turn-helix transcriptional regulator [Clostridia bacterium]
MSPYSEQDQEYLRKIGLRIRDLRLKIDYSQDRLAFESGLDRTYVGSVERGERNLSLINLRRLAIILKANPNDIIEF